MQFNLVLFLAGLQWIKVLAIFSMKWPS